MIRKYDPNGNGSIFVNTLLGEPRGLAFDVSGNLYVAYAGFSSQIIKFDSGGNWSVFATGLNPSGLAFDSNGYLYVVNNGNEIMKFNSSGNGSVFTSGLSDVNFIAIQVPEPATWNLLTSGALTLLGGLRLRRRS